MVFIGLESQQPRPSKSSRSSHETSSSRSRIRDSHYHHDSPRSRSKTQHRSSKSEARVESRKAASTRSPSTRDDRRRRETSSHKSRAARLNEEGYTSSGHYVRKRSTSPSVGSIRSRSSDQSFESQRSFCDNQLGLYEDKLYPGLDNSQDARFETSTPKRGKEKSSRRLNFANISKSFRQQLEDDDVNEEESFMLETLRRLKREQSKRRRDEVEKKSHKRGKILNGSYEERIRIEEDSLDDLIRKCDSLADVAAKSFRGSSPQKRQRREAQALDPIQEEEVGHDEVEFRQEPIDLVKTADEGKKEKEVQTEMPPAASSSSASTPAATSASMPPPGVTAMTVESPLTEESSKEPQKKVEYEIIMDSNVIEMGNFKEDSPPAIERKNYAWGFGKENDKFKVTLGETTLFKAKDCQKSNTGFSYKGRVIRMTNQYKSGKTPFVEYPARVIPAFINALIEAEKMYVQELKENNETEKLAKYEALKFKSLTR